MNKYAAAVIVLLCLGAAGILLFRQQSPPTLPNSAESATEWICETCHNVTLLTPQQLMEWVRKPGKARREAGTSTKQSVFMCDKCQTYTITRGQRCSKHPDELYPRVLASGEFGFCPQCEKP